MAFRVKDGKPVFGVNTYTAANENANSLSIPTLKFPVQLKTCRKKKVNKSRKCAQVQRMYTLKNAWAIIIIIITTTTTTIIIIIIIIIITWHI